MNKPLHYEIHVTVKTEEVNRFMEECGAVGVKPIVLDLQKQDGGIIQDVMTSSKLTGDDTDAWNRMKEVTWYLQAKGFNVVREKIETVPWHSKALIHDANSQEGYFETHIPVIVKEDEVAGLIKVAKFLDLHPSKNALKKLARKQVVQMVTLRRKDCSSEQFKNWVDWALESLHKYGYSLLKEPEIEYALYDSNVNHDASWIGQNSPSVLV
jgi:hypothetical protein